VRKIWAVVIGILFVDLLGRSVEAVPLVISCSGDVDSGKAYNMSGNLIDIAGLSYELSITADTDWTDQIPEDPVWSFFGNNLPFEAQVAIETVGSFTLRPPDFVQKYDNGVQGGLQVWWGTGMAGSFLVAAPTGMMGDPKKLLPFSAMNLDSASQASVQLGGYNGNYSLSWFGVWLVDQASSESPITVRATVSSVPDGGFALLLSGIAVLTTLSCGGLFRRRAVQEV
jgi:hypothetical protein